MALEDDLKHKDGVAFCRKHFTSVTGAQALIDAGKGRRE